MTKSTKTKQLPVPTTWMEVGDADPPKGVWLLLHGYPHPEILDLGMVKTGIVVTAYWSDKLKVFIGEEGQCYSELFTVERYHVICDQNGQQVPVLDPRYTDLDSL